MMSPLRKKILVVDDDPQIIRMVEYHLNRCGMATIHATDGFSGLKLAQSEDPDLIILDVMLPRMNGFKVCRLLKFDKKYQHIPVLMMTSLADEENYQTGLATGADEYIDKAHLDSSLVDIISKLLPGASVQ